jgi:hypothetical protein
VSRCAELLDEGTLLCGSDPVGRTASNEFALSQALALRCCLHVLFRHIDMAVTQVFADCKLMLRHVRQHCPDRVSERVPADSGDSDLAKR